MSILLDFIRKNDNWRELLKDAPYHLKIKEKTYASETKSMNVAIFNYDQIKSDRKNKIVQEARGCIINVDKFEYVCRPFDRFFNYGEDCAANIDWSTARIEEKRDGSIIKLWLNEVTETFQFSTNGMIDANDAMIDDLTSFMDVIKRTEAYRIVEANYEKLLAGITYIFELTSLSNQVVIQYNEDKMTLLGLRENLSGKYLPESIHQFESVSTFDVPELENIFDKKSDKNLDLLMESFRKNNLPTNIEGFVIKDAHGNMIKIKWQWYVEAHHMAGNKTSNSIERLVNVWKTGEAEEFFGYFPYMKDIYNDVVEMCNSRHSDIYRLYENIVKLKEEKDKTLIKTSRKDIADWMKGHEKYKIIWRYINKDLSISPINEDEVRDFVSKTFKRKLQKKQTGYWTRRVFK